jgi:hypothetical protein
VVATFWRRGIILATCSSQDMNVKKAARQNRAAF